MADAKTDAITMTIDGKTCVGKKGQTILEVAEANGVDIPVLCHHPWLSNVGACRMCVVEVEGQRRLVTACAAPAVDGWVVTAHSDTLSQNRAMVLELLFAERNHICPYCPSAGKCELQTRAYEEGITHTRYQYLFPVMEPDATNPFFVQDANRCILCGRCVRACTEIVGVGTLGFGNRGTKQVVIADLGIDLGKSSCISCGTCVDVCPTGALFDKRAPYFAKGEGITQQDFICPDDDMGCSMTVNLKSGLVARISGKADAPVNGPLLSRRSRYEILNEPTPRVTTPLVRNAEGKLEPASWEEATKVAAAKLVEAKQQGAVAGLVSGRLPNETLEAFKSFVSGPCGSGDVDTLYGAQRATKRKAQELFGPVEEAHLKAIQKSDLVVLVGFDPCTTHQVLGAWIARKHLGEQCPIISINPRGAKVEQYAKIKLQPRKGTATAVLLGILNQLAKCPECAAKISAAKPETVAAYTPERAAAEANVDAEQIKAIATAYAAAEKPIILYGPEAGATGDPTTIGLIWDIAKVANKSCAKCGTLLTLGFQTEANAAGAEALGMVGTDPSTAAAVCILQGDDPFVPSPQLTYDLKAAPTVILQASHEGALMAFADVVFPAEKWSERAGTWVNVNGLAQSFEACTARPAGVKKDEEVLSSLAAAMELAAAPNAEA